MEMVLSLTVYTARNNGKRNNGGNTTMVTDTTMVNNRMEYRGIRSTFPGFHHGVISDRVGFWRKAVHRRCGGRYKKLCKWNVSRVVGQRYSVGGDGRKRCPLTEIFYPPPFTFILNV